MAKVTIAEDFCWVCESKNNLTAHHGIPQHMKPKHNVTIPICEECHRRINLKDASGMYSYAYKIQKLLKAGTEGVDDLVDILTQMGVEKLKKKKDKNDGKYVWNKSG